MTWRKNKLRQSALEDTPFCALCFFERLFSAAGAAEFAHEAGEGFDGLEGHGVIERDPHAADRAMAGRANQAGCGGFGGKLLFDGVVSSGYAEDDIHF